MFKLANSTMLKLASSTMFKPINRQKQLSCAFLRVYIRHCLLLVFEWNPPVLVKNDVRATPWNSPIDQLQRAHAIDDGFSGAAHA